MNNNLEVLKNSGQTIGSKVSTLNMNTPVNAFGHWNENVQALAAEMGAYSKRTLDETSATYDRVVGAKSFEHALEIQADFVVRRFEDYVEEMTKIGTLYADFAQTAYQPFCGTIRDPEKLTR